MMVMIREADGATALATTAQVLAVSIISATR